MIKESVGHRSRKTRSLRVAIVFMVLTLVTALVPTFASAHVSDQEKRDGTNVLERAPVQLPSKRATLQKAPKDTGPEPVDAPADIVGDNAVDPIDMKILVITADGTAADTDLPAVKQFLDAIGIPYTVLVGTQTELTPNFLYDGGVHGYYQGIVLTNSNLSYFNTTTQQYESAFTAAEWQILWNYQALFGIRSVTTQTAPFGFPDNYGLQLGTPQYIDTLVTPINTTLTTQGRTIFPYVNEANPIPFKGAFVYLATIINPANTTPLITYTSGANTYAVASINKWPDGRENLAITAANNPNLVHSMLLSYGWINWVTKGLFLGERHANMNAQTDDLFIDSDIWDPATNANSLTVTYRNTSQDITALVNWQNAKRTHPNTPNLTLEWAFNGIGAVPGKYPGDTLVPAIKANKTQFTYVNHTLEHFNLDCGYCPNPTGVITTTPAQIRAQIYWNAVVGAFSVGITSDWDSMVQPDISGLNYYNPSNVMAQQAAANIGVRNWISDTSRPGGENPTWNTGFYAPGDSRIFVIPRRPTNLFYNLSTPAEWVSEYNYFYAPGGIFAYWPSPRTYPQILDYESDFLLSYLLKWDLDPGMFHIANMKAYDGTHSLFTDLWDATLNKYNALVKLPIRQNTEKKSSTLMQARMAYNASGVTGSIVPCTSMTITAQNAATIPVTGVSYTAANSTVETYGGQPISYIKLNAGQSVTVPIPACTP